jgi:hypothetical protein
MNTNSRSLCPKIAFFIDYFQELGCAFATATETWLSDSEKLDARALDLEDGSGIAVLYKNRKRNMRGVSHGGVCIFADSSRAKITRLKLHNPGNQEVLGSLIKMKGHSRLFAVIACYLPPSLRPKSQENACSI